jgi:hypothetical protein
MQIAQLLGSSGRQRGALCVLHAPILAHNIKQRCRRIRGKLQINTPRTHAAAWKAFAYHTASGQRAMIITPHIYFQTCTNMQGASERNIKLLPLLVPNRSFVFRAI